MCDQERMTQEQVDADAALRAATDAIRRYGAIAKRLVELDRAGQLRADSPIIAEIEAAKADVIRLLEEAQRVGQDVLVPKGEQTTVIRYASGVTDVIEDVQRCIHSEFLGTPKGALNA